MRLCSACLLGINCRYDGESKANEKIMELSKKAVLIPVCPEQLGGLPTPRPPAEQRGDKVFTKDGTEVTESFKNGAEQVLKLVQLFGIKEAILKQGSPSCGSTSIYDGNFTGDKIPGEGVTTKLLRLNGIRVISEEEI